MTSRAAAARYARALFDVVLRERGELEWAGRDVTSFADLLAANDALSRDLSNPAIPPARKRAVVEALLAQAGGIMRPVSRLLVLLADKDRLSLVPEIAEAYQQRLMDHQKIVRAEVVTAVPISPDRRRALEQGFARATGRQVQLSARVDPAIIGGAVTRIGSTIYDGSVTTQLQRMKERLVSSPSENE
jgi:F-type H+-transporting ATPase subunit delta